jgi:CRP/FNR family transcriptional regulator, cyclic AMP receptor protein
MARPERIVPAEQIAATFASVPLFRALSGRQLERLAESTTTRAYSAGSAIVRQGDSSLSFYVVLSGAVRVVREGEAGGAGVEVERLGAGGAFGEMGLIDDLPRAATVVADEATVCALLAKWDFQNVLRAEPEIALALLTVLSDRLRRVDAQLTSADRAAAR